MTDKVIVACALLLAAGYAWMTEQVTVLPFGDPLGPKAFPRILTGAVVGCALLLVAEMVFSKTTERKAPIPDGEVQSSPDTRWVVAATVAFTGLYFFLFEPLGFVLSSSAYLLAMTAYYNPGRTLPNALVSLLFPVVCYLAFTRILGVELARGLLPL